MLDLESWIAFRYMKAKNRSGLVSFISLVSMISIALGVVTLIIVLSVMNGFQTDVRSKLYDVTPHMEIGYYDAESNVHWNDLETIAKKNKHVVATAPFVKDQILLAYSGVVRGTQVQGIDPSLQKNIITTKKFDGEILDQLQEGEFGIILGEGIAEGMGTQVGDKITVLTPEANASPAGFIPRLKQFKLVGTVKSNIYELSQTLAYIHIKDAQVLFRLGDSVSGLRIKLDNPNQAPEMRAHFIPPEYSQKIWISDWSSSNQTYFEAVQLEKKVMFIITALTSLLASFNLISSLVMTVNEKRANIAILRTLGLSPRKIMKIFMLIGTITGFIGTFLGVLFGILLASNLSTIFGFYEKISGNNLINSQIYFLDYIPVDIQWIDVTIIATISLLLSFLATLYPSWRAAKTEPAKALRYE